MSKISKKIFSFDIKDQKVAMFMFLIIVIAFLSIPPNLKRTDAGIINSNSDSEWLF